MSNSKSKLTSGILRALVEAAFIIFLFYANLLMGEYDKTGNGQRHNLRWALEDIFTKGNFCIAIIAAFIGYLVFEFLRKRFK